jgi:opacity protein-like surface antigen
MKKQLLILLIGTLLAGNISHAQYVTTKVKTKHQKYTDSLKNVEYKYIFPILGQGAYSKGFDIPYPIGAMANYMWMDQGITIDNLQLGLKNNDTDIPLTEVDIIGFGDNTNTSYTVNFRPDVWVFPFLNVYGIFGFGNTHTEVNINRLGNQEFNLQSVVDQSVSTVGVGVMGAGGVGPVWISVDANWTWNKPELLDEATRVNVLGLRVGHTFVFKNKPESNIALWVGAMRIKMNSETRGQLTLAEAIPGLEDKSDQIVSEYNDWYDGLTPAKKALVDATSIPAIIDRIDAVDGSAIIRYGIDKQVKELWNGLIGIQYQYNKHWMLRSEAGLFGDRKSFLLSLNFRFLL